MAQINYEIDLRSPECRNRTKIFKPKTMRILLHLMAIILLITFCFTLESIKLHLQAENAILKNELAVKTEAAVPLLKMSTELETFKHRLTIAENLLSGYFIKTDYLEAIYRVTPPGLRLNYLSIDAEGQVELKGNSTTLQSAALYARKLQELPFISKAELIAADLNEESSCSFSISADLHQTAGGDEHEQKEE